MKRRVMAAAALALLCGCAEPDAPAGPAATPPADDPGTGRQTPLVNPFDGEQLALALASSAKRLCSSVFLSGRSVDEVLATELADSARQGLHFELGDDPPAVVGSAAGESALAVFRPHLGCTLVDPVDVDDLLGQLDPAAYPAIDAPDPGEPWPEGSRVELPTAVDGLDLDAVNRAVADAFAEPDPATPRNTRAVVVVHDGRIVAERYAAPFDAGTRQLGWSMTKTVINALTGILVKDGALRVEAPAPVADWQSPNDPRHAITLGHLLRMSSGLEFAEVYSVGADSDVVQMLFGEGSDDMGAFAADKPPAHPPGVVWAYASGTTNLLAMIQRQAFERLQEHFAFPRERLFNELGMASAVLEPDASGTFVGSSYLYATPRDWARLGLLYLEDGVWNDRLILPDGWVDYSLTPAPAADAGHYGAHVWLNRGAGGDAAARPHPELPAEMFYLSGFEGQNVVVVPSHDLVVVRMGLTRSGPSPVWALTRRILDAAD